MMARFEHLPLARWLTLALLWLGGVWAVNALAAAVEPDWIAHLVSHASTGITSLLLAGMLVDRFRRRKAGARPPWAWRVLLTGLLVLGGAQLVEALSAPVEYPDSGVLHETSGLASALALGVVVVSGVVVVGSSKRLPPWSLGLLAVAALVFLLATVCGFAPLGVSGG